MGWEPTILLNASSATYFTGKRGLSGGYYHLLSLELLTVGVSFHHDHAAKLVNTQISNLIAFPPTLSAIQDSALNDAVDALIEK
jgi:hypothetical protein